VSRPLGTPSIARAAVLIAVVTVAARLAGFIRVIVFTRIVGVSCLGDTYVTANLVPNIVFDVVVGGALTSLVVPALAGPASVGDRDVIDRTTSALLTWVGLILIPASLVGGLLARPIVELLVGNGHPGCSAATEVAVGTRMLVVFAPQIVLYGIAVILIGVLQSQRRFLGPALGPLVSSLVVIGAYVLFGALAAPSESDLESLTRGHELILSVGTTLGVVALVGTMLVPFVRTHPVLRPTLHFPPTIGRTIRAMAIAGAVVIGSQDIATAVVLRLANSQGTTGSVVLYTLAWTVFTVPWAVAAVPLATSAFPSLTAAWQRGDRDRYVTTTARSLRVLFVVVAAVAAMMGAAAGPVARIVVLGAPGDVAPTVLARGLVALAPGLIGYSLVALLTRAMYAQGDARTPATAVAGGWVVAIGFDVVLALALPADWTVAAIGIGTTIGVTISGGWMLVALRRSAGAASVAGLPRAASAAAAGGLAGAACGALIALATSPSAVLAALALILVVAAVALVVNAVVVGFIDRSTLRLVLDRSRLRRA
jgi:putative peptidoglycan lipid II flippase